MWAKGDGFEWALIILIAGIIIRLIEIFSLGRKTDLALPRENSPGSGWKTIWTRSFNFTVSRPANIATFIGGYIFHLGFFVVLFLSIPHIEIFQSLLSISWPGIATSIIDFVAVVTMISMVFLLIDRLTNPVKKQLNTAGDYIAWTVTFLPLVTGYMAYHHLWAPYTQILALHILSVELLMVVLPFTKLTHTFTLFISRWYNGDQFARKGVAS